MINMPTPTSDKKKFKHLNRQWEYKKSSYMESYLNQDAPISNLDTLCLKKFLVKGLYTCKKR